MTVVDVHREMTAERINALLNEPSIRPWVAPSDQGVIDITASVMNPDNVLLMGEHGGVMFFKLLPGIYECHTQVLPHARRQGWTAGLARACGHWLYTHTDAYEILTRVPEGHIAAKAGGMAYGFHHEFTRAKECHFRGKLVDVHILAQTLYDWVRDAPGLVERGRWVHERMHEQAERLGITTPAHDDDENHNRYVGAALEMAMNGQPVKAVNFYNRWALASRHDTISLVSLDPLTIKFDIGLMRIGQDDIEVIPC